MIKKFLNIVLFSSVILITTEGNTKLIELNTKIKDLKDYKQSVSYYLNGLSKISSKEAIKMDKRFNNMFFRPWTNKKFTASKSDVQWGFGYKNRKVYGENLRPLSKDWFNEIKTFGNFKKFKTVSKTGIMINNSNLRVIPSEKPIFFDPKNAGEGFPFDYNQNSAIKTNTPVFVSHYSLNNEWALVESSVAIGWIPVNDLAIVDNKTIKRFMNSNYSIAVKDDIELYYRNIFQTKIDLGTILPKEKQKVLIVKKNIMGIGVIIPMDYKSNDRNNILKKPVQFNKKNITTIGNELLGTPYSWGGAMGNRDCSSTTKDFFAPFGIFLPRNSKAQAYSGKYVKFNGLSSKDKKRKIIREAKPFQTLLYMNGHVMLYIGHKKGEPLILHDFWGVKTTDKKGGKGRIIVGKTAITTLEPGKEFSSKYKVRSLAGKLKGMTFLN